MRSFFTQGRFLLVLGGAGLIQASHAMIYGFGSIHWSALGYGGTAIGFLWALGVLAEIVLFQFAGIVVARAGAFAFLFVGGFAGIVRWALFTLEPGLAGMLLLQVLHGLTFGAGHLGIQHFLMQSVDDSRAGAAQGFSVLLGGIAMAAAALSSGWLYARFGVQAFWAMAALCIAGLLLLGFAMRIQPQSAGEGGDTVSPS